MLIYQYKGCFSIFVLRWQAVITALLNREALSRIKGLSPLFSRRLSANPFTITQSAP
jgi:hypothetical protein